MATDKHDYPVPLEDLERNNPASILDIQNEIEAAKKWGHENFEEPLEYPRRCILYSFSPQTWLAMLVMVLALWALWLLMLIGCLNHYSGRFAPITAPVPVYGFGLLFTFYSIVITPQRLIFEDGATTFTHILGYGPLAIRRKVPVRRLRGLSLIRYCKNKNLPDYTALDAKWVGMGLAIGIGTYGKNEDAIERAQYISARTGLPIIKASLPLARLLNAEVIDPASWALRPNDLGRIEVEKNGEAK